MNIEQGAGIGEALVGESVAGQGPRVTPPSPPARAPLFVAFEGPEGGGKSTQVRAVAAALAEVKIPHIVTREPGGTAIGEQIRAVLLGVENRAMLPQTEALLLLAARAQHVAEVITPALARGEMVLCDRFAGATFAYQGYGRGLPLDDLRRLQAFAAGDLAPDLTLLFDLPAEIGLARRQAAGDVNRLDAAGLAFHRAVRAGYLELARADRARWRIIDACRPLDVVTAETRAIVAALVAPSRA